MKNYKILLYCNNHESVDVVLVTCTEREIQDMCSKYNSKGYDTIYGEVDDENSFINSCKDCCGNEVE